MSAHSIPVEDGGTLFAQDLFDQDRLVNGRLCEVEPLTIVSSCDANQDPGSEAGIPEDGDENAHPVSGNWRHEEVDPVGMDHLLVVV